MFHQFRPKIRVYGNHRHGCSVKATINCFIWHDVELLGLPDFRNFENSEKFPVCRRPYPNRLIGFVCISHSCFAHQSYSADTYIKRFDFDLTCDVTDDPELIKICYLGSFPRLSNDAGIFKNRSSSFSKMRGELWIAPLRNGAWYRNIQVGHGYKSISTKYQRIFL